MGRNREKQLTIDNGQQLNTNHTKLRINTENQSSES